MAKTNNKGKIDEGQMCVHYSFTETMARQEAGFWCGGGVEGEGGGEGEGEGRGESLKNTLSADGCVLQDRGN